MATNNDDAIALVGLLVAIKCNKKQRKKRKTWCKAWLLKMNEYTHTNLLQELSSDPMDYRNYLRMGEEVYRKLLSMVTPLIQKNNTVMRTAISPHERLTATLRFLATGRSYECLKYSTIISPQALGKIIPETCEAIYKVLRKEYLQFPNSAEKWKVVAGMFEEKWDFPHCIGAMDGKHIHMVPPANSGSFYFNYKGRHSMVLLAIVDATYRFLLVDFGINGRISDGGVLQHTTFYERLDSDELNIPNPTNVSDKFQAVPYVFVADDAFPLTTNIMKPFRQGQLNSATKEIYNYRLSRARHVVENAFGILASRFRVFHTQINLEPDNISKVVMATCVLHNFLMEQQPTSYAPQNSTYQENNNGEIVSAGLDTTESNMIALDRQNKGNWSSTAKLIRENFSSYFMNEGKVSWQESHVLKNSNKK